MAIIRQQFDVFIPPGEGVTERDVLPSWFEYDDVSLQLLRIHAAEAKGYQTRIIVETATERVVNEEERTVRTKQVEISPLETRLMMVQKRDADGTVKIKPKFRLQIQRRRLNRGTI